MTTLDDLFRGYLKDIEPPGKAVTRAKEAHEPMCSALKKDTAYGPYVSKTLLSGSYGRDTALFYVKDVDVVIETKFTIAELQKIRKPDETEQFCLLRLTQEAIRRTGYQASTLKARRSIHVSFPEELNDIGDDDIPDLTMDVVPVLLQNGQDVDPMLIADKDSKEWYTTFPASQLKDSESRNGRSHYISDRHTYKPLAKMFRAWKKVHFSVRKTPKGFVLECLTARYHNPDAEHWVNCVHDLFKNICTAWPDPSKLTSIPEVHDISNSSPHMIPISKTIEEAQVVLQKIHGHLKLVEQAMEEADTDLKTAAKTLQRVFGEAPDKPGFPLPPEDDGEGGSGGRKSGPYSPRRKSESDTREAPAFGNE